MASRDTKLQIIVDAQNRTQGAFNGVQKELDNTKRSLDGLQSTMKGIGAAGVVALGGLSLFTKNIIQSAAGFEQTQIAFETMIGDAELAKKTLNDLAQFAARTPFEIPQIEQAATRLLAYGFAAEELIPTLTKVGDVTAGIGRDKLPQIITALGQIKAKGALTGEELRQMMETGIPLMDELARVTGFTSGQIAGLEGDTKDLGITYEQVMTAFSNMSAEGGNFHNLMIEQSTTLGGLWSTFNDNITLTARAMGQELLPYLKPVVIELTNMLKTVGEWVKEHPKFATGILLVSLGLAALAAILLPIALVLPGLVIMFGLLGTAFAFVASGPGLLIIGIIAALGFAIVQISRIVLLLKNDWDMVWLGIKLTAAEAANSVIGAVEGMVNFVISGVNLMIRAINKVTSAIARVPGMGKFKSFKIDEIGAANFGRIDTNAMATSAMSRSSGGQTVVNISGNTFLDQDSAVLMGDLMFDKLKLSNAL